MFDFDKTFGSLEELLTTSKFNQLLVQKVSINVEASDTCHCLGQLKNVIYEEGTLTNDVGMNFN